jgi:hypothetical protein
MFLKALIAACLSAAFIYLVLFIWFVLTLDYGVAADFARAQIRRGFLEYAVVFGWFAIIAFDLIAVAFFRLGLDYENEEIVLRQNSPLGRLSSRFKWKVFYPLVSVALILIVLLSTRT